MGASFYFVAGEASGDARGAELMRALREIEPAIEFHGRGGPQMRALAGGENFHDWIERAGVIGFLDVVKSYGFFRRVFAETLTEIASLRPDAVVLIDYPGFNLRLARALKQRAPAPRVIYYISPQVWAWNRRRIPQMARTLDLMLCIFPFEQELYERSGLRTVFVGHPMLDSLVAKRGAAPRETNLVALLPGSRAREVKKIFPVMLAAAALMKNARPELKFEASAASPAMLALMQRLAGKDAAITLRSAHELMQRAAVGMVASGTATMEAAFFRLPFAVLYRAAWLTFFIGRRLVRVPYLGMPNILAGREIAREFLQENARPEAIAEHLLELLASEERRQKIVADLDEVIAKLGEPGAARRAAETITQFLPASPGHGHGN